MPPPDELIEEVAECFGNLRLVRFSADRNQILAGEPVTLRWEVDASGCARPNVVGIFLNGAAVPRSGTRQVRPGRSISYTLVARGAGMVKTLGRVQIEVDASQCRLHEIQEETVRPVVQGSVRNSVNEHNEDPDTEHKVSLRRETVVELEPDGLVIRIRLKLEINNFFDPDVDVDARIGVGVSAEGGALAWYKSFAVDVDWPWWVTGITLGISKIVEEFIDGKVEGTMKPKLINEFRQAMGDQIRAFGGVVSEIETAQDRIIVTACSAPPSPPRDGRFATDVELIRDPR